MKFAVLDTVVLKRDLPEHGLRAGDLGAVVELYGADGVEVEFVQASGKTKGLVTLRSADLRSAAETDSLAVRSFAGVPLSAGATEGYAISGNAPTLVDGTWREGFIVNPTRRVLAH